MSGKPRPAWLAALSPAPEREGVPVLRVRVHVRPTGKGESRLRGYDEWRKALEVSVAARAREGAANRALCRYLAELLGVPSRQVSIDEGHKNRDKVVRVEGSSLESARESLSGSLPDPT